MAFQTVGNHDVGETLVACFFSSSLAIGTRSVLLRPLIQPKPRKHHVSEDLGWDGFTTWAKQPNEE